MKVRKPYGSQCELAKRPENLADFKPEPLSLSEFAKALKKNDPDGSKAIAIARKYRKK